ncbi:MAG: hypothetical protein RMJ14_02550 [Nitrososphaerota archaeon]|nr:hypothetical protein [Aigarchaeota archaeon]MDW8076504.1 hypothetical protein [Nitrososphaerota archaeon]
MQTSKNRRVQEFRPLTIVLLTALMIVVIVLALRMHKGFVGIILASITAFILFYWVKEIHKMLKKSGLKDFMYEVLDEGNYVSIIAQVPGSEDDVKVLTLGKRVIIKGGGGFRKTLVLPHKVELIHKSYKNGVLTIRMQKL